MDAPQETESPLIEFANIKKHFGAKRIYENLNLAIRPGELFTIIGGSGQGKSVMLKMLIGLIEADEGTIRFKDAVITELPEKELAQIRRRIGMLFQGAALFDSLNVRENVAYGLREHRCCSESELSDRVAEALESVGLPGIDEMWPADLSGGMKKRVGLARAIAVRPEVLLYDEPTTGLDPINLNRINRLIVNLRDKLQMTSIVVTHDMPSVFAISDRIGMVHAGEVIFTGTPQELRQSSDPRVQDFIQGYARD